MSETATPATEQEQRQGRRGGRPLWIIVLLLVVGAALLWGTSSMTWQWSTHFSDLRGTIVDSSDGGSVETGLVPLAVLYLAAIAAMFAVGGWVRRALGVLVVLAGLAALWLGLHRIAGVFSDQDPGFPVGTVLTAHLLAALAGIAGVVAGVVLVRYAAQLPRMGAKYQSPSGGGHGRRANKDPDTALWDELSEGTDPTAR